VNFDPDLILMDLYMPECTGLEVAGVIRQLEAYISVPIVYLSGETDVDRQMSAIRGGGDDFLTKPIQPNHLISAVNSRAKRARALRALMMRDSLTGLLNHTSIKDKLENELSRSRRTGSELVFAMIDIDKFKSINDNYGHPVGDRVIKSLARLLQQRLRKSDIVGRYGGEEFAAILLDTNLEHAQRIMDDVREAFFGVSQSSENSFFNVSFSCGLASFADYKDPVEMTDAADQALYKAKHGGRNQVVASQGFEQDDLPRAANS